MIRYLENHEKFNIQPLYDACFDETDDYRRYFYEEILPENYIAADEKGGNIRSILQLIPKSVMVGKNRHHCLYLCGAATMAEEREKGYMTRLTQSVLNDLHKNGEWFTYLIPLNERNARLCDALGFSYVMDKHLLKEESLRRRPTHSLVCRKADHSDLARLAIFAESAMEGKYGIFLAKDREYFKNIFSLMEARHGRVELYFENKIVLGYRIWTGNDVMEEVLDPGIQAMGWESTDTAPYAMARILNVGDMLKAVGTSESGQVVLKLRDPVIDDNNGTFVWTYGSGKSGWEPANKAAQMEMNIGELTAHVFGYRQVQGLPKMNVKEGFFINDTV